MPLPPMLLALGLLLAGCAANAPRPAEGELPRGTALPPPGLEQPPARR